jgi:hypothetical protein
MTDTLPPPAEQAAGFASVEAMRLAHLQQLEREVGADNYGDERMSADIKALMESLIKTGQSLEKPADRREAQGMLDYWSSTLVSLGGVDLRTWRQPKLDAFLGNANTSSADVEQAKAALTKRDETTRQIIRLGATARQWQSAGRTDGYLLYGKALQDAKAFAGQDKDIDALIKASEDSERIKNRNWKLWASVLILCLTAMVVGLLYQARQLSTRADVLDRQGAELRKTIEQRDAKAKELQQRNEDILAELEENKKLNKALMAQKKSPYGPAPFDRSLLQSIRPPTLPSGVVDDVLPPPPSADVPQGFEEPEVPQIPTGAVKRDAPAGGLPPPSFPEKDDEVQEKITAAQQGESGDPALADLIAAFDKGTEEERLNAALGNNRKLRGRSITPASQTARELVSLTDPAALRRLSPQGLHYLLFTLSLVPAENWNKSDWLDIRDDLRRNLVLLRNDLDANAAPPFIKTIRYLGALQANVGQEP